MARLKIGCMAVDVPTQVTALELSAVCELLNGIVSFISQALSTYYQLSISVQHTHKIGWFLLIRLAPDDIFTLLFKYCHLWFHNGSSHKAKVEASKCGVQIFHDG